MMGVITRCTQPVKETRPQPPWNVSYLITAFGSGGLCLFSSALQQRFGVHVVVAPCPELSNENGQKISHPSLLSLNDGHGCFDEFKGPLWVYCDGYKRRQDEVEPFRLCVHLDWIDICLLCRYSILMTI